MMIMYVDDDRDDQEMFLEACREIDSTIEVAEFGSCKQVEAFLTGPVTRPAYCFIETSMRSESGYDNVQTLYGICQTQQ